MPKRDRGASLTDLLAEATGDTAAVTSEKTAEAAPERPSRRTHSPGQGRGEARPEMRPDMHPAGHVRASDGSYVRADGAKRVSLQLKMDPDDKRALKTQAAAEGLSPAEYVARLVREDGRR